MPRRQWLRIEIGEMPRRQWLRVEVGEMPRRQRLRIWFSPRGDYRKLPLARLAQVPEIDGDVSEWTGFPHEMGNARFAIGFEGARLQPRRSNPFNFVIPTEARGSKATKRERRDLRFGLFQQTLQLRRHKCDSAGASAPEVPRVLQTAIRDRFYCVIG